MKLLTLTSLLLLVVVTLTFDIGPNVNKLDSKNWDSIVGASDFSLVEFFAPWCGHCKNLAPVYDEVATHFKDNKELKICNIDCTSEDGKKICSDNDIRGYPTLKLFKSGKQFKDYDGPRDKKGMIKWLKSKTGPPAITLNDEKVVKEFIEEHNKEGTTVVIGRFSKKDNELHKAFLETANNLGDFEYGQQFVEGKDDVTVYRSFDDKNPSTTNKDGLTQFVKDNGFPLVGEINQDTFGRYSDLGLPLLFYFIKFDDDKQNKLTALEPVAEALKGKMSVGHIDGVQWASQMERMHLPTKDLPAVAVLSMEKQVVYPYSGEINAEKVQKWCEGILDGSVKPHLQSQEVPEKNDEPVRVVVGKSFKDEVLAEGKDVLVEFYAPWCGHCKKLAPIYDSVAKLLKDKGIKNTVLAKVDSTENDVEDVMIQGYPTLIFWNSANKKIEFNGSRTAEGILKFLQENAVADKDALASLKVEEAAKEGKDEL